jgi:glucose/arabinose dehydrogenase
MLPVRPPVRGGGLSEHVGRRAWHARRGLGPRCGVLALVLVLAGCGSTGQQALVPIGAGLQGPPGMKATVEAKGLTHVSVLAFDARGRLWAATSGSTEHSGDGVWLVRPGRRPLKVVAGLRGPLGLAWDGGTLYVASLGRVDAFGGFTGTRFAMRRQVLAGPVANGENNNLVLAPSGRLVMGVSAPCDHCTPDSKYAAAIVSFRKDGSGLRVEASGIRAAYGLVHYPGTSDLFVTINQRDDLGARTTGDWLAVVRRGQDWGFPGCWGQGGGACAGVPAPVGVLEAHAAAGGVAIADGSALVAEWAKGRVLRVALTKTGEGYSGEVGPFLAGLENPLPVVTTPSGDLLVGDWGTGTIYRIECAAS